jgi:hypothetical protein
VSPRNCATPGCTCSGGHGTTERFCRRHAKRLALIREDLEASTPDKSEYRIYGTRYMLGDGERDDA